MDTETKDMNRILWDAEARRRLSLRHLRALQISVIALVTIAIISNTVVVAKSKTGNVEVSQFLCVTMCLWVLPAALYRIAQLRRIACIGTDDHNVLTRVDTRRC
jgi:hypothetical protein